MCVETPCDVQVVCNESTQHVSSCSVRRLTRAAWTCACDVGACREEAAGTSEDCDADFGFGCDFAEETGQTVVVGLVHGIELFGIVECDDSDAFGVVMEGDGLLWCASHDGGAHKCVGSGKAVWDVEVALRSDVERWGCGRSRQEYREVV